MPTVFAQGTKILLCPVPTLFVRNIYCNWNLVLSLYQCAFLNHKGLMGFSFLPVIWPRFTCKKQIFWSFCSCNECKNDPSGIHRNQIWPYFLLGRSRLNSTGGPHYSNQMTKQITQSWYHAVLIIFGICIRVSIHLIQLLDVLSLLICWEGGGISKVEGIKDFFFPGSHFYIAVVSQSLGIFIKISEFFLSNLDIFVFLFLSMLSCSLQFPISS